MKADVIVMNEYEAEIKITDIDIISEEERLACGFKTRYFVNHKTDEFFVYAVITLSGPDLPVGAWLSIPDLTAPSWRVFSKNKAFYLIRLSSRQFDELQYDYHAFDYEFKPLLQTWARKRGIRFDE